MKKYEFYLKLTRPIEVLLASMILIALSPIFLLIAIAIKIENRRNPVFFTQKRIGKNGRWFVIYKFTTMPVSIPSVSSKDLASQYKLSILGKFLRNTQLNETPQFLNIIKGDMRSVGPRPTIKEDVEIIKYRNQSDLQHLKPGITFLDRVCGGEKLTIEEREQVEKRYLSHSSIIWYICIDAYICILTLLVVLKNLVNAIYSIIIPSETMKKTTRTILFLIFALFVAFLILLLSTKTGAVSNAPNMGLVNKLEHIFGPLSEATKWWVTFLVRKTAHILEYFLLYCATYFFLFKKSNLSTKSALLISFLIGLLFAILDEYVQSFVPGRTSKATDVLVDSIGLGIGYILFFLKSKHKEK